MFSISKVQNIVGQICSHFLGGRAIFFRFGTAYNIEQRSAGSAKTSVPSTIWASAKLPKLLWISVNLLKRVAWACPNLQKNCPNTSKICPVVKLLSKRLLFSITNDLLKKSLCSNSDLLTTAIFINL